MKIPRPKSYEPKDFEIDGVVFTMKAPDRLYRWNAQLEAEPVRRLMLTFRQIIRITGLEYEDGEPVSADEAAHVLPDDIAAQLIQQYAAWVRELNGPEEKNAPSANGLPATQEAG